MTIVVVDGMGGGLGAQIVSRLKDGLAPAPEILALGTNSTATDRMMRAGADRGASGENAIRVSVGRGAFIVGPIGIAVPNGMMGEVSPAIAEAILESPGRKLLIPVAQQHFSIVGLDHKPLSRLLDEAVESIARAVVE